MAGSQLRPAEPGTVAGALKCAPESAELAKPMPPQPIQVAYTYPGAAVASSTSALPALPAQPELMSVIAVIRVATTGVCADAVPVADTVPAGRVLPGVAVLPGDWVHATVRPSTVAAP